MREYLERLLSEHYRVIAVADGEAALAAAHPHQPDLVITDIMMPRLDGYALLQRLRANSETALIPILFLSARAGEEARVEGLQQGADDYLVKPFGARELLARVQARVASHRIRKAEERALRRNADELEQTVLDRTRELQETNEILRREGAARARAEEARLASDSRQAFLLKLSDTLKPLHDPIEIQAAAARLLGEHLGVDRAAYGELESGGETMVVLDEWKRAGAPSVIGRYRIDEFGTFLPVCFARVELRLLRTC
jgi:DNA-binding response OmpR family regulator